MADEFNNQRAVPVTRYGAAKLVRDAIQSFPELSEELDESEGFHILIGVLWLAARTAIDDQNFELFDRIAVFISDRLSRSDFEPEFENAVEISFLEYSELVKTRKGRKAFKRLPDSIKRILERQCC